MGWAPWRDAICLTICLEEKQVGRFDCAPVGQGWRLANLSHNASNENRLLLPSPTILTRMQYITVMGIPAPAPAAAC